MVADLEQQEKPTLAILINESHLEDIEGVNDVKLKLESLGYGVVFQDEKEWFARGRVQDCDCMLLQCVCVEARKHRKTCRYRVAMTCAIPIDCEHGYDVCPDCDVCDCGGL